MKKGLTFIVNLVILIVGVLFIALSRQSDPIHTIGYITGVAFIVPAVINIFILTRDGNRRADDPSRPGSFSRAIGWLTCGGAMILGLVMCFSPESFRSLLVYIFALCLLGGGLFHLYMIYKGLRPATFAIWVIALPVLLIIGGVALCFMGVFHEVDGQSLAILISGIGCIIFSITSFIEVIVCAAYSRRQRKLAKAHDQAAQADATHQIEDVDHTEV